MIIVVAGIKGGSGKTTLATNLTVMRSLSGKDVLLVVVYPVLADILSRLLPSRLRRLTQPVISPPNRFSIPHPSLLTCF
jgi:anion-transporting  ArsA/GET3 family ATPase